MLSSLLHSSIFWRVPVGAAVTQLAHLSSDFDPRNYGFGKLCDLIRKTNAFEIDHADGRALRIREKPAASKAKQK